MTMPIGSTEEPSVVLGGEESVAVRVVSSGKSKSIGAEFGRWTTYVFQPTAPTTSVAGQRLCNRSLRRKRLIIKVNASGIVTVTTPTFPGSTTAVQNTNPFPVDVTITGGTLSAVVVNGTTVGTTAGTYIVPSGGTISVTYTVAPTWTWATVPGTNPQSPFDGVFLVNRDQGAVTTLPSLPNFANGGLLQINDNVRWECQQELWAIAQAGNTGAVYVSVCDEQFASDPEDTKKGDI